MQESCLQNITEETLIATIRGTKDRLVLLAPGVCKSLAQEIGLLWRRFPPDRVSLILDVDAEVCRLATEVWIRLTAIQVTAATVNR